MKVKLLLTVLLFVFQLSFSQTEKLLKGIISSSNYVLKNVNVINKTSEKSTTTNEKGEFVIAAKVNDSLLFYTKDYYLKRIKLSNEQIEQNNLQVEMIKKPEELEEVVVNQMKSIKLSKDKNHEQGKLDNIEVDKRGAKIRTGVYDGSIENGMTKIIRLFGPEKTLPEIEFATVAKNTCDTIFFTKNLKLKPEEVGLFLQFCDADSRSKKLIGNLNILSMMDFLTIKNKEFQIQKEVLE
jgi:hypothetical protein